MNTSIINPCHHFSLRLRRLEAAEEDGEIRGKQHRLGTMLKTNKCQGNIRGLQLIKSPRVRLFLNNSSGDFCDMLGQEAGLLQEKSSDSTQYLLQLIVLSPGRQMLSDLFNTVSFNSLRCLFNTVFHLYLYLILWVVLFKSRVW